VAEKWRDGLLRQKQMGKVLGKAALDELMKLTLETDQLVARAVKHAPKAAKPVGNVIDLLKSPSNCPRSRARANPIHCARDVKGEKEAAGMMLTRSQERIVIDCLKCGHCTWRSCSTLGFHRCFSRRANQAPYMQGVGQQSSSGVSLHLKVRPE